MSQRDPLPTFNLFITLLRKHQRSLVMGAPPGWRQANLWATWINAHWSQTP